MDEDLVETEDGTPFTATQKDGAACTHAAKRPFARFSAAVDEQYVPIVLFSDDARQQLVWHRGDIIDGCIQVPSRGPDVWVKDAVAMSPAHKGFAIEPYETRYLQFMGVGIVFARPSRADFMQPSIDTILVCKALADMFAEADAGPFASVLDVGSGSGFLGKFAAELAPARERLSVTLVDIDPYAAKYCESPGFSATARRADGRALDWNMLSGDAVRLLQDQNGYDLLISNPPYIPARHETEDAEGLAEPCGFWEGCGLLVWLLEGMLQGRYSSDARMVVMVTSLTLKSRRVCALLQQAPAKGVVVRTLLEREIAWKAWYAGRGGGPSYLLASEEERGQRVQLGSESYLVGAVPPGESRVGGKRNRLFGYHWHVAYVLELRRAGPAAVSPSSV